MVALKTIVSRSLVLLVLAILLLYEPASAGTTGGARGTVVNSKGLPIASARIILTRYLTYDDAQLIKPTASV